VGLNTVILSNRNPTNINADAQVFDKEYHSYCLCHLAENFLNEATKHGIHKEGTKQIVKEMLYKVAYAPTVGEYNIALQDLSAARLSVVLR